MSVTFWCPDAPTYARTEKCDPCDGADCQLCHGSGGGGEVVRPHELNLSNTSARFLLRKLEIDFHDDLYGSFTPADGKVIEGKLTEILGGTSEEEIESWENNLPTFYTINYCDEMYLKSRALRFLRLVRYARDLELDVTWG